MADVLVFNGNMVFMHLVRFLAGCSVLGVSGVIAAAPQNPAQVLSAVPAWFEPNVGQVDSNVKFFSRGAKGTLFVGEHGVTLRAGNDALNIDFRGGRPAAALDGVALSGASAYIIG